MMRVEIMMRDLMIKLV